MRVMPMDKLNLPTLMFFPTHADEAMAIYLLPGFDGRPDNQVE